MKIKYTDSLEHSYYIGPGPGNRWRSSTGNKGRFGTSPINRYAERVDYYKQYDDVTGRPIHPSSGDPTKADPDAEYEYAGSRYRLTPEGEKRLAYEQSVNNSKSRKNRLDDEAVEDVDRWIRDDWANAEAIAKGATDFTRSVSKMAESPMFNTPKKMPRIDLSNMTDAELNSILNRERMERSYNEYFNQPKENKGKDFVKGAANALTTFGEMSLTGLQIAKIIKGFF